MPRPLPEPVVLALLCVLASPPGAIVAARPAVQEPCPCRDLLDALVAKVETNYPGYHLEVVGREDAEAAYRAHRTDMRQTAASALPGLPCLRVLQDYVAFFRDGHLFVGGRPPVTTAADSARWREAALRVDRTENEVLRYLREHRAGLDPVEGVWSDPAGLRLAIVGDEARDPAAPNSFSAFVLASSGPSWTPGDVKAELTALPDGSYEVVLYDDARVPTRPHVWVRGLTGAARLQRDGLLLHMPPVTWGKLYPVGAGLEGRIDPVDPRAPTVRVLEDGTVVFHLPSHVPSHARRLAALVEQHRGALDRAETLVVDLRGNEGGSALTADVLMPWIRSDGERPPRYLAGGASMVLSTPDNVRHFERMGWAPAGLLERLRARPGELVPFADPAPPGGEDDAAGATADAGRPHPPILPNTLPNPRNVAILTDAMTVSAAESFVLRAARSGKVTLFGQPTGSSIDYQTVGSVRFGCREAGLYVGYPTIVGSDRLPGGGVRRTDGIVPDVVLDADEVDPVARILEHYRGR